MKILGYKMTNKEDEEELEVIINSLKEYIEKIFRGLDEGITIEFKETKIHIPLTIKSELFDIDTFLEINEIKKYYKSKQQYQITNNSILFNDRYYENLLLEEPIYEVFSYDYTKEGFDTFIIKDEKNNIEYEISPVSNEYMIFLLQNFSSKITDKISSNQLYRLSSPYYGLKMKQREYFEKFGLFTNLRVFFNSVKIRAKKKTSLSILKKLANSFCFICSKSINQNFILSKDITKKYAYFSTTFSADYNITVPDKMFKEDIVYYYQMALSTHVPAFQYLLYYLIIEYFFEEAYTEGWINFFKQQINDPKFKNNQDKNIRLIIDNIYIKYKYRPNKIEEEKALELVLEKYVNFDNIIENIRRSDESYIDYYKKEMVSFALNKLDDIKLFLVDLNNRSNVCKRISKRIYAIRNSIVHSKEAFENRYKPFENEEELIDELPLIRLIAEEIVFNSGEDIRGK